MKIDFWKLVLFAVIILLIIILIDKCKGCFHSNKPPTDTISVKIDTQYIVQKKDTVYTPKIIKEITYVPSYSIDTVSNTIIQFKDVDTLAIVKDYRTIKVYSDTQTVKYGNAIIDDTLYENKIQKRRFRLNQNIPEITHTATLTQPKKTILYFSLSGQLIQPMNYVNIGGGLMLKFKNDKAIEYNYLLNSHGQTIHYGSFKIPIRLTKR